MRRFWRGLVIFPLGGVFGTAFGVALGFFSFPFAFPPSTATEQLIDVALREAEAAWIEASLPSDAATLEGIEQAAAAEARPMWPTRHRARQATRLARPGRAAIQEYINMVLWENGKTMKTTIEMPDDLYRRVKIEAARRGTKFKNLVEQGLRLVLKAPREPQQPPNLAALMKHARGAVDSGIADLASNPDHLADFGRDALRHR